MATKLIEIKPGKKGSRQLASKKVGRQRSKGKEGKRSQLLKKQKVDNSQDMSHETSAESTPKRSRGSFQDAIKKLERDNQVLIEQLVKASSVIRDLEEKLYQTSRKQTVGKVMVAGLLHDLRNPLAIINSCAQLCLDHDGTIPIIQEKLQMISENVKKANELAKKFLDFTKSSFMDYSLVDVNRILTVIWKMAELESTPCHVTFEANLAKDLPEIMASQENLERVFLNLFMNAIHAVAKKGKISVETRFLSSEKIVEIRVMDDGPGIPKDQLERIFEPFHTTKEEGTGLGLNICQSLILQHKGTIHMESELGRGTTVSVRLPLQQDEAAPGCNAGSEFKKEEDESTASEEYRLTSSLLLIGCAKAGTISY